MVKRTVLSREQAEQGEWWDCAPGMVGQTCWSSMLIPAAEDGAR